MYAYILTSSRVCDHFVTIICSGTKRLKRQPQADSYRRSQASRGRMLKLQKVEVSLPMGQFKDLKYRIMHIQPG